MYLSVSSVLFVSLCSVVCMFVFLSVFLSVCISVCQFVSVSLSIYFLINQSIPISFFYILVFNISPCLSIDLSVCLFACAYMYIPFIRFIFSIHKYTPKTTRIRRTPELLHSPTNPHSNICDPHALCY